MAKKITPSTGNVFEDLGFPKEEAENLKVRSSLMAIIRAIIEEEGLTQQSVRSQSSLESETPMSLFPLSAQPLAKSPEVSS